MENKLDHPADAEESSEEGSPARWIGVDEALALVGGKTGKPGGVDPAHWFKGDSREAGYALALLPLRAFAPNEAGDRYDGTVELARARAYAALDSQAPPVIAAPSRDGSCLRILDGGHRISAARMRGDPGLLAIIRLSARQMAQAAATAPAPAASGPGWGLRIQGPAPARAGKARQAEPAISP